MFAPILSIIHIVCFAPRTPVTHLSSDRFMLSLWNISLTLRRKRTICMSSSHFFFSLGDFILEKSGRGRVVLWALSCLSFLKTKSFLMCFLGQTVLTFELLLIAVALQCLTDYSPLSLAKCMEESMVFTEAVRAPAAVSSVPSLTPYPLRLPLDSQSIAYARLWRKTNNEEDPSTWCVIVLTETLTSVIHNI